MKEPALALRRMVLLMLKIFNVDFKWSMSVALKMCFRLGLMFSVSSPLPVRCDLKLDETSKCNQLALFIKATVYRATVRG